MAHKQLFKFNTVNAISSWTISNLGINLNKDHFKSIFDIGNITVRHADSLSIFSFSVKQVLFNNTWIPQTHGLPKSQR